MTTVARGLKSSEASQSNTQQSTAPSTQTFKTQVARTSRAFSEADLSSTKQPWGRERSASDYVYTPDNEASAKTTQEQVKKAFGRLGLNMWK